MTETLIETDTHRVRIEHDEDSHRPDGDTSGTIVYINRFGVGLAHGPDTDRPGLRDAVQRAINEWGTDWDVVDRYLRMFHDVVSIARVDTESGTYMEMVTREQALTWGVSEDKMAEAADLTEWEHWVNGEVYGYIIEKKTTWVALTVPTAASPHTMTTWDEVDSCWGFYGREHVETQAREAFEGCTS